MWLRRARRVVDITHSASHIAHQGVNDVQDRRHGERLGDAINDPHGLKRDEMVRRVVRHWNGIPDGSAGPMCYAMMVTFLAHMKRFEDADRLLAELDRRNVERSLHVHHAVLTLLAERRYKDFTALHSVFDSMQIRGQDANSFTCAALVYLFAHWKLPAGCVRVLDIMTDEGYVILPKTLAKCVSACTTVSDAVRVAAIYGEPDTPFVHNAILSVAVRVDDVRAAWKAYRSVVSSGSVSVRTLNSMIHLYSERRDLPNILKVLQRFRDDHNVLPDGFTYRTLLLFIVASIRQCSKEEKAALISLGEMVWREASVRGQLTQQMEKAREKLRGVGANV